MCASYRSAVSGSVPGSFAVRRAAGINNLTRSVFFFSPPPSLSLSLSRGKPARSIATCATASRAEMCSVRPFLFATAEGHRGGGLAVSRAAANGGRLILPADRFAIGGTHSSVSLTVEREKEKEREEEGQSF